MSVVPLRVELNLGGTWTPITSSGPGDSGYVYTPRGPVQITRGLDAEADQADPAECTMIVNNRDGRFTPKNPRGVWYGLVGRNIPIRVFGTPGPVALDLPGLAGAGATTPDSGALDVTGDLDLRVDVEPDAHGWRRFHIASKYAATAGGRSWFLIVREDLRLQFSWSPDGSAVVNVSSTEHLEPAARRLALRVAVDADNGAGGATTRFYTAPAIAGPWTQLGDPVVTAGTATFFGGSAPVEIAHRADPLSSTPEAFMGRVFGLQLRGGIGAGTLLASPDFTARPESNAPPAFADSAGRTWTILPPARLIKTGARFSGEVVRWPTQWSPEGADVYTTLKAAGVLRRLQQGQSPKWSTLRRGIIKAALLRAYWPAEDGPASSSISAALPGVAPMQVKGNPGYASFDGFASSKPIPTVGNSQWVGRVPAHEGTGQFQVRCLLAIPQGETSGDAESIIKIETTGSAAVWHLSYRVTGGLRLEAFDSGGVSLGHSGNVAFGVDGKLLRVSVELTQDGTSADWRMSSLEPGASGGLTIDGTIANQTIGKGVTVTINNGGGLPSDVAVGHVTYQSTVTGLFETGTQLAAFLRERAGRRIERLCAEAGIPLRMVGPIDATARLGMQQAGSFVELIREAAEADGGLLYDDRELTGLVYRTRRSLYNRLPVATLDYAGAQVMAPFEPVDDDQVARNDVTVTRAGGGFARIELTEGPMSTATPPAGIGLYDTDVTISLGQDSDTADQAGWRLRQGTIDVARYPEIRTEQATPAIAASPELAASLIAIDAGDRLAVINPPDHLPPEAIEQIVRGYAESIGTHLHSIDFAGVPAAGFDVAALGEARYSPSASALSAGVTSGATSLSVATSSGPLWTTSASDMPIPIMIGGELMSVTAVTGASSPQTFTVIRSQNGIVKPHSSGAAVSLASPAYRAL